MVLRCYVFTRLRSSFRLARSDKARRSVTAVTGRDCGEPDQPWALHRSGVVFGILDRLRHRQDARRPRGSAGRHPGVRGAVGRRGHRGGGWRPDGVRSAAAPRCPPPTRDRTAKRRLPLLPPTRLPGPNRPGRTKTSTHAAVQVRPRRRKVVAWRSMYALASAIASARWRAATRSGKCPPHGSLAADH